MKASRIKSGWSVLAACAALLSAALLSAWAPDSLGQAAFPSRPINLYVSNPPGSDTDTTARLTGAWLEQQFKQPVVVNNRPGAGGALAAEAMLRAPQDGYSLLIASSSMAYIDATLKDPPFVAARDLKAIAIIGGSGLCIVVHPDFPARTMAEFVSYVRANPGKVNFGMVGPYPVPGIADMKSRLHLDWVDVPYPGGAAAFTALIAGQLQAFNATPHAALAFAKAGKIRVLAHADDQRSPLLPDVPTVAETVLPKMRSLVWFGLIGPAGMPPDGVRKLNAAIVKMTSDPDYGRKLQSMGYQFYPWDADAVQSEFASTAKMGAETYARIGITRQ